MMQAGRASRRLDKFLTFGRPRLFYLFFVSSTATCCGCKSVIVPTSVCSRCWESSVCCVSGPPLQQLSEPGGGPATDLPFAMGLAAGLAAVIGLAPRKKGFSKRPRGTD